MPNYKDNLNYSAQQAVWGNVDWKTLPFDGNKLRSPLTPEEEKQEESYKPWKQRYSEEVSRKHEKWMIRSNSKFWNHFINETLEKVSKVTSLFTMKDDDVNYKDEITYKINIKNQGGSPNYDSYTTNIYQYKNLIDDITEMLIKDGYYNFNLSDNSNVVDFDDDTYQNLSNQITDKIIPKMMFQKGPSGTITYFGDVESINQIIDTTLYEYGEINEKDKAGLRDVVNSTINQYIRTGYGKLAEKMYSNNVIRSNTMIENEYWFVDKEAEYIANHFNLNADMFDIRFIDPDTGKQINMTYSDFVEEYGVLKKEDIFAFNYPRGELRSYAVRFGENQNVLADVSLKTDLDVDQVYQQLRMLNELTVSSRNDLFYRDGTPTCEMSQLFADEGYNLLTYYLTSGFMEYTHLKPKKEFLKEFNEKGYYPGAEHDDKSEFYHLRRENEGKYEYTAGNITTKLGRAQINALGIYDENEVQSLMNATFILHNNAVTSGDNQVRAGTITVKNENGDSTNVSIVELRNWFNHLANSNENNRYKKMSQMDEDEINAGTDYSKFLHSISGNYIGGFGFSPKDKNKVTDVGFFAAMNGLKRSDGSLYDVYDILMSDGIEYIDTKSEDTQYDFQDRDLLIFRKRGQKHNVVSIANGNVYTLGNGDNEPQVIPIQDYINIMNTRGYSLYRYRFEGNFNPQTARFNLEKYFNIY